MSLDFQQIYEQVKALGEKAPARERELQDKFTRAQELLEVHDRNLDALRQKVQEIVRNYDPSLRCALPVIEPLTASFPAPSLDGQVTIIAADGSQINPDRHAELDYGLINVGAISMRYGSPEPPKPKVISRILYDEELYTQAGKITEARLALLRDLNEREILADLAEIELSPAHSANGPGLVSFTDGPMELWGARDGGAEATEFQQSLTRYLNALERLFQLGVATAGYVDKPGANLLVRLLEVAMLSQAELAEVRLRQPLRGVTDRNLYWNALGPGERSAVFAMQSQSAHSYAGPLALHFFYLNVGRLGKPWLARVEVPAWVAEDRQLLDLLHAVLVDQCRTLGGRAYPYLLHRAHETAVVTLSEKEQVSQMIAIELRKRGVAVGEISQKQGTKNLPGRTRYKA